MIITKVWFWIVVSIGFVAGSVASAALGMPWYIACPLGTLFGYAASQLHGELP